MLKSHWLTKLRQNGFLFLEQIYCSKYIFFCLFVCVSVFYFVSFVLFCFFFLFSFPYLYKRECGEVVVVHFLGFHSKMFLANIGTSGTSPQFFHSSYGILQFLWPLPFIIKNLKFILRNWGLLCVLQFNSYATAWFQWTKSYLSDPHCYKWL